MLEITERAENELHALLSRNKARPHQSVRLSLDDGSKLRMTIDTPHAGDVVVRRQAEVLLIVLGTLSAALADRVLDFRSRQDPEVPQSGFTLLARDLAVPAAATMLGEGA